MTLRVAIPTSYYPDHFLYKSDGVTTGRALSSLAVAGRPTLQNISELSLSGQYPEFFAQLAEKAGFTIEWTTISESSYVGLGLGGGLDDRKLRPDTLPPAVVVVVVISVIVVVVVVILVRFYRDSPPSRTRHVSP